METSILMAIASWAVNHLHIGESLEGISRELMNEHLWNPLKEKLSGKMPALFHSNQDAERFIEEICTQEPENPEEPFRDAERIYQEIQEAGNSRDMRDALLDFLKEQSDMIRELREWKGEEWNDVKSGQINMKAQKIVNAGRIETLNM